MEEPLGDSPATEATLTMRPLPPVFSAGAAALTHRPGEIDSDDLVPEFLGEAVEIGERNRLVESGVVDEDVEPAEARHNVDSQLLHRGLIGEFAGEGGRAHLMPRCEVARHTLRLLAALRVHDRDMRAFLGSVRGRGGNSLMTTV